MTTKMRPQRGLAFLLLITWLALCHATLRTKFSFANVCVLSTGPIVDQIAGITLMACSERCSLNDDCRSVYYYRSSQVCQISSQITAYGTMACPDQYKAMYGELTQGTDLDVWIGDPCASDADCPQVNAACLEGTCKCDDGYSYRHRDDSCVSFCQEYGSTFKKERYYLYRNNVESWHDKTLDWCLQTCRDYPTLCRFIEYDQYVLGIDDGECLITDQTALTTPNDVVYDDEPQSIQFIKNCA